jgi:aminopeptidase
MLLAASACATAPGRFVRIIVTVATVVSSLAAAAPVSAQGPEAAPAQAPHRPDAVQAGGIAGLEAALARRVADAAAIAPGELVWIEGAASDVAFMEEVALAVAAAGGLPLVTVFSAETLRRWFEVVPSGFDDQRDEWLWTIHRRTDVVIRIQSLNPSVYENIPWERLDARDAANQGARELLRGRGVRIVHVGNDLHPAPWRARLLGVAQEELEQAFVAGIMADPITLAATGSALRDLLRTAATVRIQHPNGTDITVGVAGQGTVLNDGTLPARDAAAAPGTAAATLPMTWLPGGELTLGIDPASARGRLVVERFFWDGADRGPLSMTFRDGRLESLDADSDLEGLRYFVESVAPFSDRLTGLKFGLNPAVTDTRMLPLMRAGMISLSMGANDTLGGDINLPFLAFFTLPGATVHVDDRVVIRDGVLQSLRVVP